jgi:hypothetical protein
MKFIFQLNADAQHTSQYITTITTSLTLEQYFATRHFEQSSRLFIFFSPIVLLSLATVAAVFKQPGAQHFTISLSIFPVQVKHHYIHQQHDLKRQ